MLLVCCRAKETHQLAEANAAKNAQLRAAFGISDFYVDGSSLDPNRKAKEEAARTLAMATKNYRLVIVNILFMAPRMVYFSMIYLLWSIIVEASTTFRPVVYGP